jgi:flagellar motor switch protein FliM
MATIKLKTARHDGTLDHRTLGRPVHLLGKFTALVRDDLSQWLHEHFNRRYRARFEIESISLDRAAPVDTTPRGPLRWLTLGSSSGRINVALDRNLLLCILGYRYGTKEQPAPLDAAAEAPAPADAPQTATEERLAVRIGMQLAGVVLKRIEALHPQNDIESDVAAALTEVANAPLDDAWTLSVQLTERSQGLVGQLWLRLEPALIARLLQGLAPVRDHADVAKSDTSAAQPLQMRLQLSLCARLLQKEIPLGTLLDLRVGSILPVTLGTTDVLIDDSRLFTASVTEHNGKLCLTSFQDVE